MAAITAAEEQKPTTTKTIDSFNNNSNNTTMSNNSANNTTENNEKKTVTTLRATAHYLFRDSALQKVEQTSIEVDLDLKTLIQYGRIGAGEVEVLPIDGEYYKNEEDFVKGVKVSTEERNIEDTLDMVRLRRNAQGERNATWVFKDGHAELWRASEHVHHMRKEFDPYKFSADCEIPSEGFCTAEECYKWNDYREIDDKGTEKVVRGEYSPLRLTEEQSKAVRDLEKAFAKLSELNVCVVWDADVDDLVAVNGACVDGILWDGEDYDEDTMYTARPSFLPNMRINGDIRYLGCESGFLIRK